MLNKTFLVSLLALAIIGFHSASAADGLFNANACDGSDPQGGVLLPKALVIRCGLCQEGKPEMTEDCLNRLVFDYKEQPEEYKKEESLIIAEYNKDDFGFATKNMVETGKVSDILRKEAGYSDEVENVSLGDNDKGETTADKSLVEECKEEQGEDESTRCFMDASGSLTSRGVSLLLAVLRSRSVITRANFVDNLFEDIIVSSDADTSDKSLMLPNQGI